MRKWLEAIKQLKVLVIGDAIRDVYEYVVPFGKASKEPILAARRTGRIERFHGGAWAAYAHLGAFVAKAVLYAGGTCMVKHRLLEEETKRKLFELHEEESLGFPATMPAIEDFDAVIVTDFGHGLMTPQMISAVEKRSQWLAVNAQTNSANHGFNLINRYGWCEMAVVDELEARLAAEMQHEPIEQVLARMPWSISVITRGAHGAIGRQAYAPPLSEPSVAGRIVDTMGAGDAFFMIAALFARVGAPLDVILRAGNAAGAAKCAILGHSRSVGPADILPYLEGQRSER